MAEQSKRIMRIPNHRQLIRADLKGKKVLVRFDFNVPIEDGKVGDVKRIDAALPTLRKILEKGAETISVICHLGRPDGKEQAEYSVAPIAKILCEDLNVRFYSQPVVTGSKYASLNKYFEIGKHIRLYENLRFDKEEEENNPAFAKELATLGDVFIQDAFANIHREHASMVGVERILPTYAGLLVEKEIINLFRLLGSPKEPFVAIIGGAKVSDKLPIVEALSKRTQAVIVGGKTANEWILEHRPKTGNIYFPTDGISKLGSIVPINEQTLRAGIFDIGPQTIMLYKSILASAKTIFWNGNLGMTENKRFVHGTYEVARFIAKLQVEKVASGGNTAEVIDQLKLGGHFNFVSTGGGATSDFIIGKKMEALEILLK